MAKLLIALRQALNSIPGLQRHPMLTMAIQPTGWVPFFKIQNPPRLQKNHVRLDADGKPLSPDSGFPIAGAYHYPKLCTNSSCFFQYYQYLVQFSPEAIQSLDFAISMLYPLGNLFDWVDPEQGAGYPHFTNGGTANLFSIFASIIDYEPGTRGALSPEQMLLGIQIEQPPGPGVPKDAATMRTIITDGLAVPGVNRGSFAPSCIAHCQTVQNEHPAALWNWPARWGISVGTNVDDTTPDRVGV